MWKLVMGIYMTIGFAIVLAATEGFQRDIQRDTEGSFMVASVGVLIAIAGTGGSLIKRRRFWWSFLFATIFAQVTFAGMFVFFETM